MEPPRRLLLVLAATLVLAGCVDGTPEATGEDPPVEDRDAGVVDDRASGDDGGQASGDGGEVDGRELVPAEREPALPPLHPVIDDWAETVVSIGTTGGITPTVDAKVAATPDERQRGLMEVEELPDGSGMLFLFEEERTGGFWMRDTLVPLDIAYIDADGVIGTILAMDPCEEPDAADCPTYVPDAPYLAALEVPQGWFARHGVAEGDPVVWSAPRP